MHVSLRWDSAVATTVVVFSLFNATNIQVFASAQSAPAPDSSGRNLTQRPSQLFSMCLEKGTLPDDDELVTLDRLNQCIDATLGELWPQLAVGIPELDLPPLDPYEFGEFTFQINASGASDGASIAQRLGFGRSSQLTIEANFTNVLVHNLTNGSNLDVKVNSSKNMDQKVAHYELSVPSLSIEGNYSLLAEGVPIFRKIEGQGPFSVEIDGLIVKGTRNLEQGEISEEEDDDADETDVTIDGIQLELLNLFGGKTLLGAAVNRRLNLHSLALFDEIKPQITAEIGVLIKRITNFIM